MANTREVFRTECDPARVGAEITRLHAERRARPRLPITGRVDFEAQASEARWTAGWFERLREQHRRLGEWARFTRQPCAIRQAIEDAERLAMQRALGARARAAVWESRAVAAVMSGVPA